MVKSEMFSLPNVLGRARAAKEMVGESKLGVVATFDLAESECISEHVRHLHQEKQLNFTPVECPISQGHGAERCYHPQGKLRFLQATFPAWDPPQVTITAREVEILGFSAGSFTGLELHALLCEFECFPGPTKVAVHGDKYPSLLK